MPGTTLIEMILGRLSLPFALVINPLLLARCTWPGANRERLPLTVALWALVLQPMAALLFHFTGIPIAPLPLVGFHCTIALIGWGVLWLSKRPLLPASGKWPLGQLWIFLLLAILVFSFTHLGGIDAYKWGDLATSVAIERNIPWLAHPLSLLGFTPRSYPSLHPLLMGTIRALGGTGLDAAFYLASLVMCAVGVTGAAYLAQRLRLEKREALLFTAFYVLSPVFMRYVHWGTGRGAFLAVLPIFVAALSDLPRPKAWSLALLTGLLLVLAHKTGLICVPVLLLVRVTALLYPRRHPMFCLSLLVLSFAASLVFAPVRYVGFPVGSALGWIRYDLARFAWLSPALVLAALVSPRTLFRPSASSFMWLALLVTFPVAHHMEMYPAMIALPFIVYAGSMALRVLPQHLPGTQEQHIRIALLLTLIGALAIVVQRSIEATPHRVYLAARHIEKIDPYGPFEIVSPWRSRIQGIVTGCPRFTVTRDEEARVGIGAPPAFTLSDPHRFVTQWAGYIRGMLKTGTTADWYGSAQTRYHVLPATSPPPANVDLLYNHRDIAIYREPSETLSSRNGDLSGD